MSAAPNFAFARLNSFGNTSQLPIQIYSGHGSLQGQRDSMEDQYLNLVNAANVDGSSPASLFAILDGHNGVKVATLGAQKLPQVLFSHPLLSTNPPQAIVESIVEVDRQIFRKSDSNDDGGSCLVAALVFKGSIFIANLGDSRAVLCDANKCIALSVDHKPEDPREKNRIERCGGYVKYRKQAWRVNGRLGPARALGDFFLKENSDAPPAPGREYRVSNLADICQINITDSTRFLLIACDGFWDVVSNESAIQKVNELLELHAAELKADPTETLNRVCQELAKLAIAKDTHDNVSVMIVLFHDPSVFFKGAAQSSG